MRLFTSSVLICLGLGLLSLLPAQEFRATIGGQVQDSQQALVPGASVTVTNNDTGAQHTTRSGNGGQFTLPLLPPGTYTLTSEAPGFKRYTRGNLVLTANQRSTITIELEVGNVTESVTVTAAAPLLATGTASVGQGITSATLQDIPMWGRTPLTVARLSIGVVDNNNSRFTRPMDNGSVRQSSMAGSRVTDNELLMDGAPVMYGSGRSMAYSPPVDSVEEVKVDVFQSDAAYGNTSGGTMSVLTKSGTNQFHGTANWYNQVSKLAARPFFEKRAGNPVVATRYNQWGLTAGGPVIVPKVMNGKNKVFWYFAYEGIQDVSPTATVPTTITVPTAAQRGGDFSALLALGPTYQIYDPLTAVAEGSRRRRQPLAGNVIPGSRLNSIALNYLGFFPQPNQPGRENGQNNFVASPRSSDDYYNFLGRADFNFGAQHKLSGSARSSNRANIGNKLFPENEATGHNVGRENWGVILDDVYGFSSGSWLNARLSWSRFINSRTPLTQGFDIASLGFPASMVSVSPRAELPWITFSDPTVQLGNSGINLNQTSIWNPSDYVQLFATFNTIVRSHSLKFGTEIRRMREHSIDYGHAAGQFVFGTDWVRGPLDNSPGAPLGQSMASFLLGMPTGGGLDLNAFSSNQSWYSAFFIQDDWRARSNLTLNIGLRYETETPTIEWHNRTLRGFDHSSPNRVTAAAKAAYAAAPIPQLPASQFDPVGGPVFASSSQRNVYSTPKNGVSPRIGIAYRPSALGQTVVRAGFGIFVQPYGARGIIQPGFSQRTPVVPTQNGYLTPYAALSNPFPDGIQQPVGAAGGLDTNLGQSVQFFNPELAQPYTARWTFSIQKQLSGNLLLETAYIGSRSLNQTMNRTLNFVPAQFLSTSPVRDQATINLMTSNVTNPFRGLLPGTGLNGSTVAVQRLLVPYPQYSNLQIQSANEGYASYHGLGVRLEKRFSSGAQFLLSYTFSKNISADSRLNPSDAQLERTVSADDRPHRFAFTGGYELPFGKGKPVGGDAGQFLNGVIGGWKLSGNLILQISGPLGWGNLIYYGGDINLRYGIDRIDKAFDTTRFNTISNQQLAQNVRTFPSSFGSLRGDTFKDLDLSLRKEFRIHETLRLQYEVDAFNVTNHVTLGGPNLNASSSAFGAVTSQLNLPRKLQMALRLMW